MPLRHVGSYSTCPHIKHTASERWSLIVVTLLPPVLENRIEDDFEMTLSFAMLGVLAFEFCMSRMDTLRHQSFFFLLNIAKTEPYCFLTIFTHSIDIEYHSERPRFSRSRRQHLPHLGRRILALDEIRVPQISQCFI